MKRYITLKNGWFFPYSKNDINQIMRDYSHIYVVDAEVKKISAGFPILNDGKHYLVPGAILTFQPNDDDIDEFSVGVKNDGLLNKVFKDFRVRSDLKEAFLNPQFVNGLEQIFFDGLDGEYKVRDAKVSFNKNLRYLGFNLNWDNQSE